MRALSIKTLTTNCWYYYSDIKLFKHNYTTNDCKAICPSYYKKVFNLKVLGNLRTDVITVSDTSRKIYYKRSPFKRFKTKSIDEISARDATTIF